MSEVDPDNPTVPPPNPAVRIPPPPLDLGHGSRSEQTQVSSTVISTTPSTALSTSDQIPTPIEVINRQRTRKSGLEWKSRKESFGSESGLGGQIRQKRSRDKQGWGNLSLSILHLILTHALEDVEVDVLMKEAWGRQAASFELVQTLTQRVWLCDMRLVSTGWKTGVDSHTFWPTYTLIIDRSKGHHSTVIDLYSSSLTPSTPTFPTLFHRSRHSTLSTCLACRLNRPDRLGLYPANRKRLTITTRFGYAPTCDRHHLTYCGHCMKEDPTQAYDPNSGHIVMIAHRAGPECIKLSRGYILDTDERGDNIRVARICASCRTAALQYQLEASLFEYARGGPITGLQMIQNLGDLSEKVDLAWLYIMGGRTTASITAGGVLDLIWLRDQTRWYELLPAAQRLQMIEEQYRIIFRKWGKTPTVEQKQLRMALLAEMRGEEVLDHNALLEDQIDLDRLYKGWTREIAEKFVDDEDELTEDEDEELVELEDDLNGLWAEKLRAGCINDFISDRIRFALWVSPSDEVRQLLYPHRQIHAPFSELAKSAHHPIPELITDIDPAMAVEDGSGIISTTQTGILKRDYFLPSERILRQMEQAYAERLRSILWNPLREVVNMLIAWSDNYDDAETECAKLGVDELLRCLRNRDIWFKGVITRLEKARRATWGTDTEDDDEDDEDGEMSAEESRTVSGETEHEDVKTTSPRVELLVVEDGPTPDYGIEIASSEVAEGVIVPERPDEGDTEQSPRVSANTLGKRKAGPQDDVSEVCKKAGEAEHTNSHARSQPASEVHASQTDARRLPVVPSSSPGIGQSSESAKSSSEDSTIPQPITPDEDTPSPISFRPLPTSTETSETGLPITKVSSSSISPSRSSTSTPEIVPLSRNQARAAHLHTRPSMIPYIPTAPAQALGGMTVKLIKDLWWDVRSPLRECRCGVCVRQKQREVHGALGWIESGGEGGKRLRLQ